MLCIYIEVAHSCRMNSLDLVFAIDTSVFSLLDITSQNWNSILEFTRTTIAKLTSGTSQRSYHQFGYVTYSASVENVIRLQHSSGLDSGLFEDIFSTLGGFLNEVNMFYFNKYYINNYISALFLFACSYS